MSNSDEQAALEPRAALARSYIIEAINNSHTAIKNCWVIMFTAGTYGAIGCLNDVMRCKDVLSLGRKTAEQVCGAGFNDYIFTYIIAFFVYFLTFARFYLGDVRIFDIKYSELFKISAKETETLKTQSSFDRFNTILQYSDRGMYKFEVLVLLFQTLVVVALALELDVPENFISVYAFLLLFNSIWLISSTVKGRPIITEIESAIFPEMHTNIEASKLRLPKAAGSVWVRNNVLHSLVLIFGIFVADNVGIFGVEKKMVFLLCMVACLSNCIFDFVFSHNFYFPRFHDSYDKLIKNITAQNDSDEAVDASRSARTIHEPSQESID